MLKVPGLDISPPLLVMVNVATSCAVQIAVTCRFGGLVDVLVGVMVGVFVLVEVGTKVDVADGVGVGVTDGLGVKVYVGVMRGIISVVSLAELLAKLESLAVSTEAVLTIVSVVPGATTISTRTITSMSLALSPGGKATFRMQVTACPAALHTQSVPRASK